MYTTLVAGALAATALISGPVPAPATTSAEHKESDVKEMPWFASSQTFGELRCPPEAPYLENHKYRDGVPPGIEVRVFGGDGVVDVLSLTVFHNGRPAGIASASTFNWALPLGSRSAQLVAHCVSG